VQRFAYVAALVVLAGIQMVAMAGETRSPLTLFISGATVPLGAVNAAEQDGVIGNELNEYAEGLWNDYQSAKKAYEYAPPGADKEQLATAFVAARELWFNRHLDQGDIDDAIKDVTKRLRKRQNKLLRAAGEPDAMLTLTILGRGFTGTDESALHVGTKWIRFAVSKGPRLTDAQMLSSLVWRESGGFGRRAFVCLASQEDFDGSPAWEVEIVAADYAKWGDLARATLDFLEDAIRNAKATSVD